MLGLLFSEYDGHILEANDAFLSLIGYTREALTHGRIRWNEITPAEYHPLDTSAIRQLQSEGVARPYEKAYIRKDGDASMR